MTIWKKFIICLAGYHLSLWWHWLCVWCGMSGHRVKAVFRRRVSRINLVFQIIINDPAVVVYGKGEVPTAAASHFFLPVSKLLSLWPKILNTGIPYIKLSGLNLHSENLKQPKQWTLLVKPFCFIICCPWWSGYFSTSAFKV